jgi:hypothetical protein
VEDQAALKAYFTSFDYLRYFRLSFVVEAIAIAPIFDSPY